MAEILYKNIFGRIMNDFSRKRIDSSICFFITNNLQIVNMHVHFTYELEAFFGNLLKKIELYHATQHLRI